MIQYDNIFLIPSLHYSLECAQEVFQCFHTLKPDCVALELPQSLESSFLHATSRLPDISVLQTSSQYFLIEPCDPFFEAARLAQETQTPVFCIDKTVYSYPLFKDPLPDPYSIFHIGLMTYYEKFLEVAHKLPISPIDLEREEYMAHHLKNLSLQYDKILFIGGMHHCQRILEKLQKTKFCEDLTPPNVENQLYTISEESCRTVLATWGWLSKLYEEQRQLMVRETLEFPLLDRQDALYLLYKEASQTYSENYKESTPHYFVKNSLKFARKYAFINNHLQPDLFQLLNAAKCCGNHNYAYETWVLATHYPYLKNIDALEELHLKPEDIWGKSKKILFHLIHKGKKQSLEQRLKKGKERLRFNPPSPFNLCSYPPEDTIVENFGEFLKKKGVQILKEEQSQSIPFSTSLEDGIDVRETLYHWPHEKKIYVKKNAPPPGNTGSVVIIFDEDEANEYTWKMTWLGENDQESDMAFYATPLQDNIIGPGISRCEYGGFMLSFPPRRLLNIWTDFDYTFCQTKPEVLLAAAVDYATQPLITYVAASPPRSQFKSIASRLGKKIIYIPIGQLSPITIKSIRSFHVLDSQDRRSIADEYIF